MVASCDASEKQFQAISHHLATLGHDVHIFPDQGVRSMAIAISSGNCIWVCLKIGYTPNIQNSHLNRQHQKIIWTIKSYWGSYFQTLSAGLTFNFRAFNHPRKGRLRNICLRGHTTKRQIIHCRVSKFEPFWMYSHMRKNCMKCEKDHETHDSCVDVREA